LEYVQIYVYYNPHTDTGTCTRVNVNAPLVWVVKLCCTVKEVSTTRGEFSKNLKNILDKSYDKLMRNLGKHIR